MSLFNANSKYFNYLDRFLTWLSPHHRKQPGLVETANEAKRTWKQALEDFNHVIDQDLIDFAVHNIKASERRYMALIRQAKEEKATAWPEHICSSGQSINQDDTTNSRLTVVN